MERQVYTNPYEAKKIISITDFQKRGEARKTVGSEAFNLEYLSRFTDEELVDDMLGYLGEYRFEVEKYDYKLKFSADESGKFHLRDMHSGESMVTKAEWAIADRKLSARPIHREVAERDALIKLDDMLRFSKTGDSIIWASPAGPKEEGYGDYGFIFVGEVSQKGSGKEINMRAIRLEKAKIGQYKEAMRDILGEDLGFEEPDDFLSSPQIVRDLDKEQIEKRIARRFNLKSDNQNANLLNRAKDKLSALTVKFADIFRYATEDEKRKALYTLENFAILLRDQYLNGDFSNLNTIRVFESRLPINYLISKFSQKPPQVAGSCGSSGEINSNNPLANGSSVERSINFNYKFDQPGPCVTCGENIPCGPCGLCMGCDIKAQKEGSLNKAA